MRARVTAAATRRARGDVCPCGFRRCTVGNCKGRWQTLMNDLAEIIKQAEADVQEQEASPLRQMPALLRRKPMRRQPARSWQRLASCWNGCVGVAILSRLRHSR